MLMFLLRLKSPADSKGGHIRDRLIINSGVICLTASNLLFPQVFIPSLKSAGKGKLVGATGFEPEGKNMQASGNQCV
jgi:hypothetical protein